MNVRGLLVRMDRIFPHPVTMEYIRGMGRRELTEAEKKKPYASYFYRDLAEIPAEDLAKVNAGPVDPARALSIHQRDRLLEPGYLEVETGYTVLEDGSGFAATLVRMPGVTPRMLDWWFNWHPLEGLRYALWCPVAHVDISVDDPARHLDSSKIPLEERNYGSTHYPVEGFNVKGAQKLAIRFFFPEAFGLNTELLGKSPVSRVYCANVTLCLLRFPFNVFMHTVREVGGGVEYRSRYWIGYTMRNGKPVKIRGRLPVRMVDLARNNCVHSLIEYNNLASFLPELYRETGGRIDPLNG